MQSSPPAVMPEWLRIARSYKGIHEVMLNGKLNPQIAEMFKATSFPLDKLTPTTPWCAAFVSHCLEQAGMGSPHTAQAAACASYGTPVLAGGYQVGDVVVLAPGVHGAGISGHVGFYELALNRDTFWLFSGNCSNTAKSHVYPTARIITVRRPIEAFRAA